MKKDAPSPSAGRKSAYVARNRNKILLATQEMMGELGPECTVEAIAERAEVAVSTVYKHFDNRDALFQAAVIAAFEDWEAGALGQVSETASDLEKLVRPLRLFMRIVDTHPTYGRLIKSQPNAVLSAIASITSALNRNVWQLVDQGILRIDDVDVRLRNLHGAILQNLEYKLQNPETDNSELDRALEIALSMIGISASQAKRLCSMPL